MRDRTGVRAAMQRLLELVDAPVRSVWSGREGQRIHHLEAGGGAVVILLHGGTGGGANWFRLIGPLARSFRVLAPDLPGFGLSDPLSPSAPLGRVAADLLVEWLEVQEVSQALVVGTSFGGLAALRLTQRAPGVSGLLLLDSAGLGRAIHASVRFITALPLPSAVMRPSRRVTALTVRWLLTTDLSELPSDHRERLIDYLYASARATGAAYVLRTLRLFAGVRGQREVVTGEELASLGRPVSIVWGERDRLIPVSQARAAAARIPRAVLHVVPRVGHSPNWERPAAVLEAVLQLARRAASGLPDRAAD
ncbi:MAG TPA: alpha/beta fold hydrolase [Longimicrobiales bacterium]